MKESKTTTMEVLLKDLRKEKQKEVTKLIETCMKAICCEGADWKKFQVFNPSCEMMRTMLNALAPEYLMAIADKVNQKENPDRIVKISILPTKKETSVYTINQNSDVTLAYISLSDKRRKELEEKAKEHEEIKVE